MLYEYASSNIIIDKQITHNMLQIENIARSLKCELRVTYEENNEGYEVIKYIVKTPSTEPLDTFIKMATETSKFKHWFYTTEKAYSQAFDFYEHIETNPLRFNNAIDMLMESAYFNEKRMKNQNIK